MTTSLLGIALPLLALYLAFLAWYGGNGKPLSPAEIEAFFEAMNKMALTEKDREILPEIRRLLKNDDGKEFVMQNLVRYRPKALYPAGYSYGDSAVEADRRYGRAIIGHLLKYANLPIFIARRKGFFVEPEQADKWHVVVMVRYRSRRDFLRFAAAITGKEIAVHKWAAIEKTHIFPVQPIISLVFVRAGVAALLTGMAVVLSLLVNG